MNVRLQVRAVVVAAVMAGVSSAQPTPSFEAASIRPLQNSEGAFHYNVYPNRLDVKDMNLRFLIEDAFDLPEFEVSGSDSLRERHFDIMATTGAPVLRAVMRAMLLNLLLQRFHLATHWDTRTETIYRLEVLPSGSKMTTLETGYAGANSPMRDGDAVRLNGPMSMRQLAQSLTRFAGKPVLDATNLEGFFKIDLKFASEEVTVNAGTGVAPFLRDALQEQLGLRLVQVKEPVKYLVVDHFDDVPVAN